jgi:hypothetical protein
MNIWLESKQELLDCWFIEDCDVGDRLERSDNLGAFCCGQDRPACSFLNSDLFVGVNANDQYVAQLSRAREISNVADMKHVEAAIRENDSRTGCSRSADALN